MVRGLAEARGLSMTLRLPGELPLIEMDRTRIRQVLLDLLTNATRFTDEGGIQVAVAVDDAEVVVAVEDSGRGVSSERISQAFEGFTQLEDGQAREGSGLGLAVSRRFVELHGGRIRIESELGRGTVVAFTLPIPDLAKSVQLANIQRSAMPVKDRRQPLVLVLHDDSRVLSLLRRHIAGCEFRLSQSLEDARHLAHRLLPSAVIVDADWSALRGVTVTELGLTPQTSVITCPLPSMRRLESSSGRRTF